MKASLFIQTRYFEAIVNEYFLEGLILKQNLSYQELDKLTVNKTIWIHTGLAFKHSLSTRPFFYAEIEVNNIDELQETFNLYLNRVDDLFQMLWLIKDCSCSVDRSVVFAEETKYNVIGGINRGYSNSTGSKILSSFSQQEIDSITSLGNLESIFSEIKSLKAEKSDFENKTYFSFKDSFEYNDLNRIQRAYSFAANAIREHILPAKISYYVLALECLFSADDNTELSHKVSERVAFFLRNSYSERVELFKDIKIYYDIRSKYVHGQKIPKAYATNEVLASLTIKLDIIVRETFLKIIVGDYVHFLDDNALNNYIKKLVFGFDFSQTSPSEVK